MKTSIEDCVEIVIPRIADSRGNLAVIEGNTLPFPFKRVYFLYDVPSDAHRGGHAHKEQQEFLIAVSGSFDVILDDVNSKKSVTLNKPNKGLLIPRGIWRELENFSSGAICLVFSSGHFLEEDYIRQYKDFLLSKST
ncbi:MAG: WxcM-like domain-containing protein [Flavobacteriales bacterium]|jgi:dTDP-4-dehydrorhamnose 3,5-epimerase-like enzyme|nr:WxcM-like domain-containing protein [Flavobacteriales bacterium]